MNPFVKNIVRVFESFNYQFNRQEIFRDFCEMYAVTLSAAAAGGLSEDQHAAITRLNKKYNTDDLKRFAEIEKHLLDALTGSLFDVLGQVYMALEIHSKNLGQFFTPSAISQLMAQLVMGDIANNKELKLWGFIETMEPTVGGGGMVLQQAQVMLEAGLNPQAQLCVYACDIDITAVHMSYIHFSLAGLPAIVVHGNSLNKNDIRSVWKTGMFVIGKWNEKLNFRRRHEAILKLMRSMGESPAATEPEERQKTYSINPPNPIVISKGDAEKLSEMREKRRSWIAENKQFIQQSLFE